MGTLNLGRRPEDPPIIKEVEVLWNPFDDIVPRSTRAEREAAARRSGCCWNPPDVSSYSNRSCVSASRGQAAFNSAGMQG